MARMRKKRNISERMEACRAYWYEAPRDKMGRWRERAGFSADAPLFLEIGCGKGAFVCALASRHPTHLFIALERHPSVILAAIEKAAAQGQDNIRFIQAEAADLSSFFSAGEVDRIYLNFSDPWERKNKPKRRLTHRDFLDVYKRILKPGGQIHFKTDNTHLFAFSLASFSRSGLLIKNVCLDVHNSQWKHNNICTEFEARFAAEGMNIMRAEAHLPLYEGE